LKEGLDTPREITEEKNDAADQKSENSSSEELSGEE